MDEMTKKLFEAIDPNNDYSMDDFNAEYSNVNTTFDTSTYKIPLNFVNKSDNENPSYAKDGDSGFDVRANLGEEIVVIQPTRLNIRRNSINTGEGRNDVNVIEDVKLHKAETKVVPTGLFFEIPRGYEIQVRSRSGLAAKAIVAVTNSPGTVDSGYRGELKIILTNIGNDIVHIKHGERIAQCVFSSVLDNRFVDLKRVEQINTDTDRGDGGFGHTGLN